jgi:hypothetical protein
MVGHARRGLLGLCEQRLLVPHYRREQGFGLKGGASEGCGIAHRRVTAQLNDLSYRRPILPAGNTAL